MQQYNRDFFGGVVIFKDQKITTASYEIESLRVAGVEMKSCCRESRRFAGGGKAFLLKVICPSVKVGEMV